MDSHHQHTERHFSASEVVRDAVIGASDGLTVPFALAAGLSGAIGDPSLILTAGLAEVAAGAIAMGLGGYLAAKSEADHFFHEEAREKRETIEVPEEEEAEVAGIFRAYGVSESLIPDIVSHIRADPKRWVDFMMRFELGLNRPDPQRALKSAVTIAGSYVMGGLIPLAPYRFTSDRVAALVLSTGLTLTALFVFGFLKGRFTTHRPWQSAIATMLVGGLAAMVAYFVAKWVS